MVRQDHHQLEYIREPNTETDGLAGIAHGHGMFQGGDFFVDAFKKFLGRPAVVDSQLGKIFGAGGCNPGAFKAVEIESLGKGIAEGLFLKLRDDLTWVVAAFDVQPNELNVLFKLDNHGAF